ncbi:MAG TPA: hypothetical protein VFD36_29460 [Kofleriaceae bacterium]|nr:hypothetical protein [Kofleriaceae bacterium]
MSITGVGLAVVEEIIEGALKKKAGKTDHPDLASKIKSIAKDELALLEKRLDERVDQLIAQLQLGLAIRDMADEVAKVPAAFEPKGTLPNLFEGAKVEPMDPDDKP